MKRLAFLLSLPGTALLFFSCAAHQVAFNEADFVRYAGSGSGVVTGQVFRVDAQNTIRHQNNGTVVKLMPATVYTDEIVQRKFHDREHLAHADARLNKYVRRVHVDANGNFVFRNVPAGNYYVACHYEWTHPEDGTDSDGNYEQVQASDDQWLYTRTSVVSGKTSTVTSWDQGR
jgi:hypothetical protein